MEKVVLAFSGGLDTTFAALYLKEEKNFEVHTAIVNTGGFSEEELKELEQKAYKLGVAHHETLEETQVYYEKIVKYLIFGNILKNNTYPLSVSSERVHQAIALVNYAKKIGAKYIAHGSTGAGNDQIRFDMIFKILAPEIEIITPIRDLQLTREEEIEYLKKHGVEGDFEKSKYSYNVGLWGTSIGGKETLTSHEALPEEAFLHQAEKTEPQNIEIEFTRGELTAFNGKKMNPVEVIRAVEEVASQYGIGRDYHIGDTIIGLKGRIGFEAAAATVIIKAHHTLEKHTLTKWQLLTKEQMMPTYGTLLHEGQYLDPVMRDFEAFLESSQKNVNGKVTVELYPYRFMVSGIQSPNDLMNSDFGDYGEMNRLFTSEDAKGFINVLSNSLKIYHHVNNGFD
jgi:argininosuccinate synthase